MDNSSLLRSTYHFHLPETHIAKTPITPRDHSKLMVVRAQRGIIEHRRFDELPSLLPERTLLVRNNSCVIPARLRIRFASGAKGELFFLSRLSSNSGVFFVRPGKKFPLHAEVSFIVHDGTTHTVTVKSIKEGGERELEWHQETQIDILHLLERHGEMPYPPYIGEQTDTQELRERYQTVYAHAERKGSVAAPTAGLHFTERTFRDLAHKNTILRDITLHVGAGTFLPVKTDSLQDHKMHNEWYEVSATSAEDIQTAWNHQAPLLAVGTTSLRVLEHAYRHTLFADIPNEADSITGSTDIFIYPPQKVHGATMLLTNFHLPESTLLMLVCAFAGDTDLIMNAYKKAIENGYRFYSFGDAMLILP